MAVLSCSFSWSLVSYKFFSSFFCYICYMALLNKELSLDKLLQQFFIFLVRKNPVSYNHMQKAFKLSQLPLVIELQTIICFSHTLLKSMEKINSSIGQQNGLLILEQVFGHACDANICKHLLPFNPGWGDQLHTVQLPAI